MEKLKEIMMLKVEEIEEGDGGIGGGGGYGDVGWSKGSPWWSATRSSPA